MRTHQDVQKHYDVAYKEPQFPFDSKVSDFFRSASMRELLFKTLSKQSSGLRVGDLGCSNGALLALISNQFPRHHYTGIDFANDTIARNRKSHPQLVWVCSDVLATDLPDRSFDVVLSTMVIEHVDDVAFAKEVGRLLTPSGNAFITSVQKKPYGWYYLKNEAGESVMELSHLREYKTKNEFMELFSAEDFAAVRSDTRQIYFPALDFIIRRMWPWLASKGHASENLVSVLNRLRPYSSVPVPGYASIEVALARL